MTIILGVSDSSVSSTTGFVFESSNSRDAFCSWTIASIRLGSMGFNVRGSFSALKELTSSIC